MILNPIKTNMTEVKLNDYIVLFSYKTPVAVLDRRRGEYLQTEHKWSKTTTRHINQWLDGNNAAYAPQSFFDNLFSEVK